MPSGRRCTRKKRRASSWTGSSRTSPTETCPPGRAVRRASVLADELGDHADIKAFSAFLAAVAALLDPAEGRLRNRNLEAVDADHAGLKTLAKQFHALRRIRERIGREAVGQAVGACHHLVEILEGV